MILDYKKVERSMTYVNFFSLIEWLTSGIPYVCGANSFKSRLDKFWSNQELIYIIFVLKFVEPEAEVKLYIKYQCIMLS